jgi:4-amino-4-deoxy-L-arabinose transferase-like glycosyltransferase
VRPSRPHLPLILAFAALKLLIHLFTSANYGYFRDELYFIACGRHLDWGYVDHSPLIGVYARIGEWLGPSLRGFRLPVTIAGALRIVLTGVITARLGGGRAAQALACTAVLFAPIYLGIDSILTMNTFEHLFWLGCILVVIELANGASPKLWLAFGALAGLGLMNKHSMVFLGFAIVVALLFSPLRREFLRPWLYLGGVVAALIFLPNLLWQIRHDFPTLELLRNVKETGKNVVLGPVEFLVQQVMMLDPFAAPLWLAGLVALFFGRFRFLAIAYLVVLAVMFALEGKDYYVAPIYPMLFAAGAVWMTRWRFATIAMFVLVIAGGAIAVPLALPLLSPERYLAYQRALGVEPQRSEVSHTSEMPQLFADQFGWEELVRKVAQAYHALPAEERARTAIFCGNYGQAGAIDFYGPKYGLPPAISGHQNYFYWGPRGFDGASVILVGDDDPDRELFASVTQVGTHFHRYGMPEENGPIWHARGLKVPVAAAWPRVKNWR